MLIKALLVVGVSSLSAGQTYYNLFPSCCPGTLAYVVGSNPDECNDFNACEYLTSSNCPTSGTTATCLAETASGVKISLAQAKTTNFVSFYQTGQTEAQWLSTYANKMITIIAPTANGPVTFQAKIVDTCSNSDVPDPAENCDSNTVGGYLVDVEYYTAQRLGLLDSSTVTWNLGSLPPTMKPTTATLTCPSGWTKYGDGSACTNQVYFCSLWGNPNMAPCKCPGVFRPYGDGSACTDGVNSCALWGNVGQNRCVCDYYKGFRSFGDGSACTLPPSNVACALWGNSGMPRCCPLGYTPYGDGSACTSGVVTCSLWGNPGMPVCFP